MPLPKAFSVGLPKAELHCHIEGTVTPKQKWDLARRNNVRLPYDTYEELLAAHEYSADNPTEILRKFLDLYYANHVVFKSEQDYRDIMFEHLRRCASGNVRYTEIFFGAQGHLALGIPLEVLMNGLRAGIEEAEREFTCLIKPHAMTKYDALAEIDRLMQQRLQASPAAPHSH